MNLTTYHTTFIIFTPFTPPSIFFHISQEKSHHNDGNKWRLIFKKVTSWKISSLNQSFIVKENKFEVKLQTFCMSVKRKLQYEVFDSFVHILMQKCIIVLYILMKNIFYLQMFLLIFLFVRGKYLLYVIIINWSFKSIVK